MFNNTQHHTEKSSGGFPNVRTTVNQYEGGGGGFVNIFLLNFKRMLKKSLHTIILRTSIKQ